MQEVDPADGSPLGPATVGTANVSTVDAAAPAALGTWVAAESHKYKFTVKWPTGLAGDNAFQKSTLDLGFSWSAAQA